MVTCELQPMSICLMVIVCVALTALLSLNLIDWINDSEVITNSFLIYVVVTVVAAALIAMLIMNFSCLIGEYFPYWTGEKI